jgi:hypothetical protein
MVGNTKNSISFSIFTFRIVVKFDLNPTLLNCHKFEWHQLILMQGNKQPQFYIGKKSLQQQNDKTWKLLINFCEFKLENLMFVEENLFLNMFGISCSHFFVIFW